MAKEETSRRTQSPDDEADLLLTVRAAQQGDRGAITELIERFELPVFATVYRRLGNVAAARDLCRKVFIRALADLRKMDDPRAFGPRLRSLAGSMAAGPAVEPEPIVSKAEVFEAIGTEARDAAASGLPDESSEEPQMDLFARGPFMELMERFRERLLREGSRIAGGEPVDANHLEQAYQILLSEGRHADWSLVNRRRLYLIRKRTSGEISPAELAELAQLQAEADRHMHEVAPRALEDLWDLKETLRRGTSEADRETAQE